MAQTDRHVALMIRKRVLVKDSGGGGGSARKMALLVGFLGRACVTSFRKGRPPIALRHPSAFLRAVPYRHKGSVF